jgi:hypothetical protein
MGFIVFRPSYLQEKQKSPLLARDLLITRSLILFSSFFILQIFIRGIFPNTNYFYGFYNNPGDYYRTKIFPYVILWLFALLVMYFIVISRRELNKKQITNTFVFLNNSSLALKLTKYYLTTKLPDFRKLAHESDPLNFDILFKKSITQDIDKLVQAFKANDLKPLNAAGVVKHVLYISEPLRNNLRDAIAKFFQEMALESSTNANLTLEIDNIWKKINKAFLQWESSIVYDEVSQQHK